MKARRMFDIKKASGYAQFAKREYAQALKTFGELDVNPLLVISLFPDFVPAEVRDRIPHPIQPPVLEGEEFETACKALVDYLTLVKTDFSLLLLLFLSLF